jgi:hypothetical protein
VRVKVNSSKVVGSAFPFSLGGSPAILSGIFLPPSQASDERVYSLTHSSIWTQAQFTWSSHWVYCRRWKMLSGDTEVKFVKHHDMKTYGGSGSIARPFLTLSLYGGERSDSRLCRFTPGGNNLPIPIGQDPGGPQQTREIIGNKPIIFPLSSEDFHWLFIFVHLVGVVRLWKLYLWREHL